MTDKYIPGQGAIQMDHDLFVFRKKPHKEGNALFQGTDPAVPCNQKIDLAI